MPAAQVLVNLLVKCGKLDAAIDVAAAHLAGIPESSLSCPSLDELCQRAGQSERLAQVARETRRSRHLHRRAAGIGAAAEMRSPPRCERF